MYSAMEPWHEPPQQETETPEKIRPVLCAPTLLDKYSPKLVDSETYTFKAILGGQCVEETYTGLQLKMLLKVLTTPPKGNKLMVKVESLEIYSCKYTKKG